MTNINTDIYDRKVNRSAMLRLFESKVTGDLMVEFDGHTERLDDVIRKGKIKGRMSDSFREALDKELVRTFGNAKNISERHLKDLFHDQTSYTANVLEDTLGIVWRVKRPSRQVAEEFVLRKPLYRDTTLSRGWAGISLSEKKRIEKLIRRGIADGLSEDALADFVYKNNPVKLTKIQAKGLAITGMTSVYTQADHAVYMANKGILKGWQYIAVLDSRTTALCAHRNGTVYPVGDTSHLPPAHWHCRSSTVPVVKSYEDMLKSENIQQIRKRNLSTLSKKKIQYYDSLTHLEESYDQWLMRQPQNVQLKHLGDYDRLEMFLSNKYSANSFVNYKGEQVSINELRKLSDNAYTPVGDTTKFIIAKERLDSIHLGAARPEELYESKELQKNLREYYKLQATDLNGTLSYTNYRGVNIGNKRLTRQRVLNTPPSDKNLRYNPLTGRYDDARMYQPNVDVYNNSVRLVESSDILSKKDKDFIKSFGESLEGEMGYNERAVIVENLRVVITRYRKDHKDWGNLKGVIQSQIKYDIMNVSDSIETQLRKDANLLKKLEQINLVDPYLGPVTIRTAHDDLISNIKYVNNFDDKEIPALSRRLRHTLDRKLPAKLWLRLDENAKDLFYLRLAKRLALADSPDRDQLAVSIGKDLYNAAGYRGSRREWYELGVTILDHAKDKGIYELDSYGVQKRRMRSKLGGHYFGPYYDTQMIFLRITDPKILKYAKTRRAVEVGMRVGAINGSRNRFVIRKGYKTYFIDEGVLGYYDTRIPITSTDSFGDFPEEFVDDNLVLALNHASSAKYKVDSDYYVFMNKLLHFKDDKGRAKYYDDLNEYRKHIVDRGDSYERLKMMQYMHENDAYVQNNVFVDHRGRIYERGFVSPQAGETYRPFLRTVEEKNFSENGFYNLQDQIGAFLGGSSDKLEGRYNSLSIIGRQKIAEKHRKELIKIGEHMLRGKPEDIRAVLDSPLMKHIDGEEQPKLLRFALEMAKINRHLEGNYSKRNLVNLKNYKTSLALEQDASSSGAQIIALTTRNKQLAELSNVIPTTQKKRLYDEVARDTFHDPRFKKLNKKLGLTEKDLRKAAKAQNMVTFYGAGEKTGTMNVEAKLAKILEKDSDRLVIRASERDQVLNEISARMARYEKVDPDTYLELKALRNDVKDSFNKGQPIGDDLLEQLYFLDPKTRDIVEKLSKNNTKKVTPDDFTLIAEIMSEHLANRVPILKDFTKFYGRLAQTYLETAKPSESSFNRTAILQRMLFGQRKESRPPRWLARLLGIREESYREKFLRRFGLWDRDSLLDNWLFGVKDPKYRRTGFKVGKYSLYSEDIIKGQEIFYPNKLPKDWTNIPWVNFDGKIIEQRFTQSFEEKLLYKDSKGKWVTSIVQVKQKTDPTWWEEFRGKEGKINDIADTQKARTAFAVNGNHSNDATIVKRFHIWGSKNNIQTSTIHDAFFTNAADMLEARAALRQIYADSLKRNSIEETLLEMRRRGLPEEEYQRYRNEAIDIGLIPVVGRSRINGKLLTEDDILKEEDILGAVPQDFSSNRYWYGVG